MFGLSRIANTILYGYLIRYKLDLSIYYNNFLFDNDFYPHDFFNFNHHPYSDFIIDFNYQYL